MLSTASSPPGPSSSACCVPGEHRKGAEQAGGTGKAGAERPRPLPTAGRLVTVTERPWCARHPAGLVPRGARAAGRGRPSLVRVRGVLGPRCRVFVGRSPWASLRALRGRCSRACRCPQPAAPASCRADESAAGSLPLVSVSLSTPLTAAEMAPYMKRLSRGQSVEGESGGQGPPGPGRVDTQSSRCLPGHFLPVGAERVLEGEAGPRAGEGRHAGARAPDNAQGQGLLPFRGYPWRGGWQQTG